MSDTRDEQPAVGRWAKCIHCGARSVLLLCEKCAAQATEEHVARQRALKENGRLRTERLAREAAAGEAAASPAPRTAFGAAHGSPSLTWTVEKPRASGVWWWWNLDPNCQPDMVEVRASDVLSWCGLGPTMHWPGLTRVRNVMTVGGVWAGPVNPPETPSAETTANSVLSEPESDNVNK